MRAVRTSSTWGVEEEEEEAVGRDGVGRGEEGEKVERDGTSDDEVGWCMHWRVVNQEDTRSASDCGSSRDTGHNLRLVY